MLFELKAGGTNRKRTITPANGRPLREAPGGSPWCKLYSLIQWNNNTASQQHCGELSLPLVT